MKKLMCLGGLFLPFLGTSVSAETNQIRPYLNTEIFLYSEPVSINALRSNWKGNYQEGGEKQTASLRTQAGVTRGRWTIAGLYREDYYLNFSSDTADLYYGVENDLPISRTSPYKLSLDAYRFRGLGVVIKKAFAFNPRLHGSVGVSVFKASNLLDGKLSGQAQSASDDEYSFQVQVDAQYEEDPLFDRQLSDSASGIGMAIDADITWQASPKLQLSLAVNDIAGLIRWNNVPYTSAKANSDNVVVNDTGFTQVSPILSGEEGFNGHFTQSLKPSAKGTMRYALGQSAYSADASFKYFEGLSFFGIGLQKRNRFGTLGVRFWPEIDAAELSMNHKQFGLSVGVDNINLDDTRSAWVSLSYGN